MRKLVLLLTLAFALVSCTPAEPAVEVPIESEITVELAETYSVALANGELSFMYPEGWFVGGDFPDLGVIITNDENYISGLTGDVIMETGKVFIQVLFAPENMGVMVGATPESVVETFTSDIEGEAQGTISEITSITLNGNPAAYITLDSNDGAEGIVLVVDSGDAFTTMIASIAPNERRDFQATIEAIAGSFSYILSAEAEATAESTAEAEATAEMTSEAEATAEATESTSD
ncbi:MAG: hypothetical protein AAFV98_14520 [Chloroflexota bacterium]